MENENINEVGNEETGEIAHDLTIDLVTAVRNGSADTLSSLKLKATNIIGMSLLFVLIRIAILFGNGNRHVDIIYGISLIMFFLVFIYFIYKKRKSIEIPDKSNASLNVDLKSNILFLRKYYKQSRLMGWFIAIFFAINLIQSNGVIPSLTLNPLNGWLIVVSDIVQFIISGYYLINLFIKSELKTMEELREELED